MQLCTLRTTSVHTALTVLLSLSLLLETAASPLPVSNHSPTPNTLTLVRFDNTALVATASSSSSQTSTTVDIPTCAAPQPCDRASSLLLSGQLAPTQLPGLFGFRLDFAPALPYPSAEGYARLWVNDHLLYPTNTTGKTSGAGRLAPLYVPLPEQVLDAAGLPLPSNQTQTRTSFDVRLEFVCMAAAGCASRNLSLTWARWDEHVPVGTRPPPAYTPIPSSALVPTPSATETARREVAARVASGWGTFYFPSMLAWSLLPQGFVVKATLFQRSTGALLSPEGLVVNSNMFPPDSRLALKAGLHAVNHSLCEASITWLGAPPATPSHAAAVNLTLTMSLNDSNPAQLSLSAAVNSGTPGDFMLVLFPNFTHGRSGDISASHNTIQGRAYGLDTTTLTLLQGTASEITSCRASSTSDCSLLNYPYLAVQLSDEQPVVVSSEAGASAQAVLEEQAAGRARERATIATYGEWAEAKDAVQTGVMWALMYDPRHGVVFPEYHYDPAQKFGAETIDGDTSQALFCWDGGLASYMLSLDALDLALTNLVQIVRMRTSAGFVPAFTVGTFATRDHSQPPLHARILRDITKRWGLNATRWAVELCFDTLFTWNSWMYTQRREPPLNLLSYGTNPYLYAPDGTSMAQRGEGGGAGFAESGLDNGPMYVDIPFNRTGRYVEDAYEAGLTGTYMMDTQAQLDLAELLGRSQEAAVLRQRLTEIGPQMVRTLWNETAGFFQNRLSADLTPVPHMAPTSLYPLLAGPVNGPSEAQAATVVERHVTNPERLAVWPSPSFAASPRLPPGAAWPLVQWFSEKDSRGFPIAGSPHVLCATYACNLFFSVGNYVQRAHGKVRYEGMAYLQGVEEGPETVPLYNYVCYAAEAKASQPDYALGRMGWTPAPEHKLNCSLVGAWNVSSQPAAPVPAMFVYEAPQPNTGQVALEQWYKAGDHYVVGSDAGKAEAAALGYTKQSVLGYVWLPPGAAGSVGHFGMPSITKDDATYVSQDYWRGRIWGPMLQISYWALAEYSHPVVRNATAGLVAQSYNLLRKEWRGGWGPANMTAAVADGSAAAGLSFAGIGHMVFENYGADTGEGHSFSSSAQPLYHWGALAGFIGLQAAGFY